MHCLAACSSPPLAGYAHLTCTLDHFFGSRSTAADSTACTFCATCDAKRNTRGHSVRRQHQLPSICMRACMAAARATSLHLRCISLPLSFSIHTYHPAAIPSGGTDAGTGENDSCMDVLAHLLIGER